MMSRSNIFDYARLRQDRAHEVVGDRVFFNSEGRHSIVQGKAVIDVIPLLDGTRTVADIAELLGDTHSLTAVLRALSRLSEFGHLTQGLASENTYESAWFDRVGVAPLEARNRLASTKIGLISLGEASESIHKEFRRFLEESDLTVEDWTFERPGDSSFDLVVALVDDYLHPGLEGINRKLFDSNTNWLLARCCGSICWLGPHFIRDQAGCWNCLEQRLRANRQVERFISELSDSKWAPPTPATMTKASVSASLSLAQSEIFRIVTEPNHDSNLTGKLFTLDLLTLESARHVLVKQPQCIVCGDADKYQLPQPVVLNPQPKRYSDDGGHRVCTPHETVERLEKHVSPFLGAITSLYNLTEPGDEVTHSYVAGHNFAMFSHSTYVLRRSVRGLSGGKGRSDIQAKASAMCEAIERYCGVWRGDEFVIKSDYNSISDQAIHPNELLCFSKSQYDTREEWNKLQYGGLQLVPEPFDTSSNISWAQVWSLTHDNPKYVPAAYCYYGNPDGASSAFCYSDSNGNAAGNTLEEAVLQGLLELIERDSVALWWYNRLCVPEISLESIEDPYVEVVAEYYESKKRDLWLLDITSDLGIPSVVAVSKRNDHPKQDIVMGFGAHVDPKLAAMRAITECNQFLPMLAKRDSSGNTIYDVDDREALLWWESSSVEVDQYLVPNKEVSPIDLSTKVSYEEDDITKEILHCVGAIEAIGSEVLVLDQSRPEMELRVAKVMAPGLRHFWRRLGGERLYNAPVEMKLLTRPLSEAEMNPKSVFF